MLPGTTLLSASSTLQSKNDDDDKRRHAHQYEYDREPFFRGQEAPEPLPAWRHVRVDTAIQALRTSLNLKIVRKPLDATEAPDIRVREENAPTN